MKPRETVTSFSLAQGQAAATKATVMKSSKHPMPSSWLRVVAPFPLDLFYVNKPTRGKTWVVADASTLMDENGQDRHLERLYAGSGELGLSINFGNGKIVDYKLAKRVPNPEIPEEIAEWNYVPTAKSIEEAPEYKNTRVGILNT